MATIYLNADTGNDTTGDGTEGLPYLTVSKAHTEATDGDIVILQDSVATYLFTTQIFTKSITLRGEDNGSRVSSGNGSVLDGAFATVRTWSFDGDKTISMENLEFTRLRNLFNWGNFYVRAANSTFNFTNCIFHNIEIQRDGFIMDRSANVGVGSQNAIITITGCLFYDLNGFSGQIPSIMSTRVAGTTVTMHNNVVHADIAYGYVISAVNGNNYELKNNIFYNNTGASFSFTFLTGTFTSNNNCYFENWLNAPTSSSDITDDPLFVDPVFIDYRLRPSSPCIGTGTIL